MNPFMSYDRLQRFRDDSEVAQVRKDEWIRNKADELSEEFPQCAMEFYRASLNFSPYKVGLDSDEAQDAYAAFVEAVCQAKAKQLWDEAYFMGEVA